MATEETELTPDLTDSPGFQEELTLEMWDGNDAAKGKLLLAWGMRVEKAIHKAFPTLSIGDIEDVVAEAIKRFWKWRANYDPEKATIYTMLYRFAEHVACEYRSGRYKWQKERIREVGLDAEFFQDIAVDDEDAEEQDTDDPVKPNPLQRALKDCFEQISELQQEILQHYADANGYEVDSATIGKELGNKHKNGVPIPGGTIRTNKSRAWDSINKCMKKKNFDLKELGYINE